MCRERIEFLEDAQHLAEQSCFPMPPEYTKANATLILYMLEKIWRESDSYREGSHRVWKIIKSGMGGSHKDMWNSDWDD